RSAALTPPRPQNGTQRVQERHTVRRPAKKTQLPATEIERYSLSLSLGAGRACHTSPVVFQSVPLAQTTLISLRAEATAVSVWHLPGCFPFGRTSPAS